MNEEQCTICKHYGISMTEGIERAYIYDESGNPVGIKLCPAHSVELFKRGQKRFLVNHYKILTDLVSSDETKFLDILEKTVRSNSGSI